ncbi:MAG TPA: FAD-dependent oxidoreductase [Pseudonocardiaceae bacterium]|nr:FAD-dependent oxidoreductase [Pseudonocardiaceae bacterium]
MRVIVVGAGVAGASVAHHLSRAGVATVLVDQDLPGQATAAGAGIVCPWSSRVTDPEFEKLADAAADYYPALADELGEIGYRRVGALRLVSDDSVLPAVTARCAGSTLAGSPTLLDPDEARKLFPPLRDDMAAVHIPGGARVDGRLLRDALRRSAGDHGAALVFGAAKLVADGSRVVGVDVDGQRISGDVVVVAAGAWTTALLAPIGVDVAVAPQRGQITHLVLTGVDTSAWPVVLPPSSHYLLAFDGGRIVVGATRETGAGFDYRVTAAGQAEVLTEALSVAPGLGAASLLETRIGFRPAGPDRLPLLGRVPGVDGLVVLTGLGPSGLMLGPLAGKVAASLALGETPEIDVAPFDPLRS